MRLRLATRSDISALRQVMADAIAELQPDLSPAQIAASAVVMGLDTQLIDDGGYWMASDGAAVAGCGGWSGRATLYGGDHSLSQRAPVRLDPAVDAARVRAMYTAPAFARRGVGRLILARCEREAAAAGFARATLMATLAGEPLYRACGWHAIERFDDASTPGAPVPLVRMEKALAVS